MNATGLLRSTPLETPVFNTISGIVHLLWLLLDAGTMILWWQQVRFKRSIAGNYKGVSKGAKLIMWVTFCTTISEFGYLGLIGNFSFSRSNGVVGDPQYTSDQFGYLNSEPTFWCNLTSYMLYWGLSSMILATWLLMHHVYVLAVSTGKKSSSSLDHDHNICSYLLHHPTQVVAFGLPVVMVVIQGTLSQQGPMGSYCGIRCNELGIDEKYTSKDTCYVRLIAFYWLCLTFGPAVLWDAFRLVRHIRSVQNMSKKNTQIDQAKLQELRDKNKNKGSTLMRDRLTRFSVIISIAMFGASILRIGSSMNPDPLKEGTNGMTEYFGLVVSPFMILTFSVGLWSHALGCSDAVKKSNEKFVRRNSYNRNTSESSRTSNLRRSDLSTNSLNGVNGVNGVNGGAAAGSTLNSANKYISDSNLNRATISFPLSDSSAGVVNSSISTVPTPVPLMNSPSSSGTTPSKYVSSTEEPFSTERP